MRNIFKNKKGETNVLVAIVTVVVAAFKGFL